MIDDIYFMLTTIAREKYKRSNIKENMLFFKNSVGYNIMQCLESYPLHLSILLFVILEPVAPLKTIIM